MKRRVYATIQLDQSLRQSRAVWLTLAVVVLPAAAVGMFWFMATLAVLFDEAREFQPTVSELLWSLAFGPVAVLADFYLFRQVAEATRRLQLLREDPTATVRPLPAPLQSSVFGPYH